MSLIIKDQVDVVILQSKNTRKFATTTKKNIYIMVKSSKCDLSKEFQSIVPAIIGKMRCVSSADMKIVFEMFDCADERQQHIQCQFTQKYMRYRWNREDRNMLDNNL